ncbi:MAG: GTPase [Polyangiales bacterium]
MLGVALVGYTNAGKSTLLHTLTGAEVLAEDKLFATLDPRTRRLTLSSSDGEADEAREAVITDTVGFIRELPKGSSRPSARPSKRPPTPT